MAISTVHTQLWCCSRRHRIIVPVPPASLVVEPSELQVREEVVADQPPSDQIPEAGVLVDSPRGNSDSEALRTPREGAGEDHSDEEQMETPREQMETTVSAETTRETALEPGQTAGDGGPAGPASRYTAPPVPDATDVIALVVAGPNGKSSARYPEEPKPPKEEPPKEEPQPSPEELRKLAEERKKAKLRKAKKIRELEARLQAAKQERASRIQRWWRYRIAAPRRLKRMKILRTAIIRVQRWWREERKVPDY